MDVRQALRYCENPNAVDRDFGPAGGERAWREISRLVNGRWQLDPLAAEVHRLKQDRVQRVSTSKASHILLAMEALGP